MKSIRKPHNQDAGYIAEKIFQPSGSHIVIYNANRQGICPLEKYAIVCSMHGAIAYETSIPRARKDMKNPQFCEDCWNKLTVEVLASVL